MRQAFKSMAALLLVVCLLLSAVPTTFAATTTLKYRFTMSATQADITTVTGANPYDPYIMDIENDPSSDGLLFTKYSTSSGSYRTATYLNSSGNYKLSLNKDYTTLAFNSKSFENGHWYAIQVDGISAGTYDMTFRNDYGGSACGKSRVYVVKKGAYDLVMNNYISGLQGGTALTKEQNDAIYKALYEAGAVLNAGNEGIIDSQKNGLAKYQSIGLVAFPETGNATDSYVLMFQSAGASLKSDGTNQYQSNIYELQMTPVDSAVAAVYTTTAYPSVYTDANAAVSAINEATSGTVKLFGDMVATEAITVNAGVTLDLNGKTLTATVDATQGTVTDSSNGAGSIVGSSVVKKTGANEVAIKSGNTYKIFDYTMTVEEAAEEKDNGSVNFWFKVALSDAALGLIDDGTTDFAVGATMQWTPTEGASSSKNVALEAAEVTKWAGLMQEEEYWFYLNVTGFDTLGDVTGTLTVTPTISGNAGTPIDYTVN